MNTTKYILTLLCMWIVLLAGSLAFAVPGTINYQGKLTDKDGYPLDGTYQMSFYIYNAITGGNTLWNETQTVTVTDGIYNVQLGSDTPLSSDVFSSDEVYLEVVIYNGSTDTWETLSPRQRITSTAFSFRAANADTLEGHASADFALASHEHSAADITSGTIPEARIPDSIARDSEITWGNLSGIPSDIADGDDVGLTNELDPTVLDSVKDGVSWEEIENMPADFADGVDDVGLTAETDPQVGTIDTYFVPRWDGTALVNSSIYNDSSNNIGIGTTAPACKLHVENSDGAAIRAISTGGAGAAAGLYAESENFHAVLGVTKNADAAVMGRNDSIGPGIKGQNQSTGPAITGYASTGNLLELYTTPGPNLKLTVNNNGDLQTTGTIESTTGGFRFPDATLQTTAAINPIAFGVITSSGAVYKATSNVSSSWNTTDRRYEITISGETYIYLDYVTHVTVKSNSPLVATTDSIGGKLLVYIHDQNGNRVQKNFCFIVYKP